MADRITDIFSEKNHGTSTTPTTLPRSSKTKLRPPLAKEPRSSVCRRLMPSDGYNNCGG